MKTYHGLILHFTICNPSCDQASGDRAERTTRLLIKTISARLTRQFEGLTVRGSVHSSPGAPTLTGEDVTPVKEAMLIEALVASAVATSAHPVWRLLRKTEGLLQHHSKRTTNLPYDVQNALMHSKLDRLHVVVRKVNVGAKASEIPED